MPTTHSGTEPGHGSLLRHGSRPMGRFIPWQAESSSAICSSCPRLRTQMTVLLWVPSSPHVTEQCCQGPVHHLHREHFTNVWFPSYLLHSRHKVFVRRQQFKSRCGKESRTLNVQCSECGSPGRTNVLVAASLFVIRLSGGVAVLFIHLASLFLDTNHLGQLVPCR